MVVDVEEQRQQINGDGIGKARGKFGPLGLTSFSAWLVSDYSSQEFQGQTVTRDSNYSAGILAEQLNSAECGSQALVRLIHANLVIHA